jgi:hypothetical protein
MDVCPLPVISIDEVDGGICSTEDCVGARRCGTTCERTGVVNGLLLTSLSKLFSFETNCLAVKVEPRFLTGF